MKNFQSGKGTVILLRLKDCPSASRPLVIVLKRLPVRFTGLKIFLL